MAERSHYMISLISSMKLGYSQIDLQSDYYPEDNIHDSSRLFNILDLVLRGNNA